MLMKFLGWLFFVVSLEIGSVEVFDLNIVVLVIMVFVFVVMFVLMFWFLKIVLMIKLVFLSNV